MIAIDTNILVYAHGRDSEWHEKAPLFVGGSESRHGNGKAGINKGWRHRLRPIAVYPYTHINEYGNMGK